MSRFYRRLRRGRPVVVVSGLPRSGTSMVMQMLQAGGMELVTDGVRSADEDNPRGYLEHERVKGLADEPDGTWLIEARGRAVKVISYLLPSLPPNLDYKIIFMLRDLDEILASQNTMLERRGEAKRTDLEPMKVAFENHLRTVGSLFEDAAHLERLDVAYAEVIARPREQAERINRFVGATLDVDRMARAVDPALYRNRG